MIIWVDGDACPKAIKAVLFKAAMRTKTELYVIANHFFSIPESPLIKRWIVESGFDVADNHILNRINPGDLVITADIPLADAVIAKKAQALNPRGRLYTAENIKPILAARNFNQSLRDSGVLTGGAASLSTKDIQAFSNHLDRILSRANQG